VKNVLIYTIGKVVFIALFVYTFGEFHVNLLKMDAFDRAWNEGRIINVDVELPLTPAIITIVFGIIMLFVSLRKYRKSPFKLSLEEFEENDEREVLITSKATKGAYTSIVYSAFFAIAIHTFATSRLETIPALPIYLMGAIVIISSIVYAAVWCFEYRK